MDNVASGQNAITTYLGIGTYYLSIEFTNNSSSGMVVTNYALAWGNQGESINYNTNNDVTAHLHQVGADFYKSKLKYNNSVSGFYQIVLTGFDLNGNEVAYPSGMIKMYSDSSRTTILDRYDISNNNYAINETGENAMYIYLPEACCYIDIDTDRNDFESLALNILPISEISLDYSSSIETITQNNIIEDVTDFAYFKQVTISHRSKFILEVLSNNNVFSELPIYIFEKLRDPGYEVGDDHFYIEHTIVSNISFSNAGNELTIILEAGTYYFGYSNNTEMSLSFTLTRLVNNSEEMYNTLITDPGLGFVPGSEVRFNNGLYGGLTITEGFTRNLFFSQEYVDNTEESRLEYDWYSSNPNVASVSEFGTVLALNVIEDTLVKIYAVNKADPSKVYCIELTILKETKTEKIVIECNMSYSYSEENGMYTLELDFSNSPYPYIGYYVWDIECLDEISIDMDHHDLITSTGTGEAILTANYTLNMRVFLVIHLTITE